MRPRLLELLRCPACRGSLQAAAFSQSGDDIQEGVLTCACGAVYPIVGTIPRMLPNAFEMFPDFQHRHRDRPECRTVRPAAPRADVDRREAKTQESFGYQWTTFSEMACDFEDNFWNYLKPATPEFFKGRVGLDAGCGFGRHIYHAAACGAEMVGMDFSRAIEATYSNTKQFPNVHLVQGDIYAPPFAEGIFDFVYSVGVLHHLPDPLRGVRSLVALVKSRGTFFVWLYSKSRRVSNFILEMVRSVTTRMPHLLVKWISLAGAVTDQVLILPYQMAQRTPGLKKLSERVTPPRMKLYSHYPFQVLHADWFDRLAAPIRFYYNGPEVDEMMRGAGLEDRRVAPTGLYGWRGCGVRP